MITMIDNDTLRTVKSLSRKLSLRSRVPSEQDDLYMEGVIAALNGASKARITGTMIDYLRKQYGRASRRIKRLHYVENLTTLSGCMVITTDEQAVDGYFLPRNWSKGLTPRETQVIKLLFWGDHTSRTTAKMLNITEGRVSQLQTSAFEKLRRRFAAKG